jgi:hypothetical protein
MIFECEPRSLSADSALVLDWDALTYAMTSVGVEQSSSSVVTRPSCLVCSTLPSGCLEPTMSGFEVWLSIVARGRCKLLTAHLSR